MGMDEDTIRDLQEKRKRVTESMKKSVEKEETDSNWSDSESEEEKSTLLQPRQTFTAPSDVYDDIPMEESENLIDTKSKVIAERESDYHSRRFKRNLSPERHDPFAAKKISTQERSYSDIMKEQKLEKEQHEILMKAKQAETEKRILEEESKEKTVSQSEWDDEKTSTPKASRWDDATPRTAARRSRWDQTPVGVPVTPKSSEWDMTPANQTPRRTRSRWDDTPVSITAQETPKVVTEEASQASIQWQRELEYRNRFLTEEEIDALLPSAGYSILEQPLNYVAVTPSRKLDATPSALTGFQLGVDTAGMYGMETLDDLPFLKQEDYQFFKLLLDKKADEDMTLEEAKERKILKLLLKIKNGDSRMKRTALRQITERAREFGADALFSKVIPLMNSPTLEDQERHMLVKVIDRILYKLDDLVRPFVHKILVVAQPLLISEDYYVRVEGREIISNLSKAAGLASMISAMRPDIDNVEEYVRNTTSRAFAVVASALGVSTILPFLKAVCSSRKSWQARHTGIKIIQQIAILLGCGILPHLKNLVDCVVSGLEDDNSKVRIISALAVAALAEASAPYGIESFDSVLKPLWIGIRKHRTRTLAAFLKAIGFVIPLMDPEYASYYTKQVMNILVREFQSPDEEMKKIVLKVIQQCVGTEGVESNYIKQAILPDFYRYFWIRRMATDRRCYRQLVDTTVEIANKVGVSSILAPIVDDLKDESEVYRRMVMDVIGKVVSNLGTADIDKRLEQQLIDGILFTFQSVNDSSLGDNLLLDTFGTVIDSLGLRCKPHIPQIAELVLWRLNYKAARVRQQAADLVAKAANVMHVCGEEKLLAHMGTVLYEYLGEEYPEVLGSILGALKAIVSVIGMSKMQPPIKDLLPRLTPIVRNRHEKVQENVIDLVGRIADRASEAVSAREWMRICFELLDTLKAQRRTTRRSATKAFGYISRAIGPQDVLGTLLNNLKVQERQNRLCTTIAIAIVAETCAPFTVLPALMNEYRVPEMNVQNGVLKSLSFLFEYIGEMGKDYIYAVTPLLEDALIDRDLIHRQTACQTIRHMSLSVYGFGCEDALIHLLNHIWPNIFEASPHMVSTVLEAIDSMRLTVGPGVILNYVLQGLFHPARRVREVYWKIYNNLYIGSQDALVAFYPRFNEEPKYIRHELELTI